MPFAIVRPERRDLSQSVIRFGPFLPATPVSTFKHPDRADNFEGRMIPVSYSSFDRFVPCHPAG